MEESTDKQNVVIYNDPFVYHWNNYVLNNNQGSLVWLLNSKYRTTTIDLFYYFDYDKEDKINKLVLDEIPQNENGWYSGERFNGIFAKKKGLNGKLNIRENLLKYIRKNPNNNYASMLYDYGDYCLNDAADHADFTKDERFKIAAYMAYYLRLIYLDNSSRDSATDEYILTNDGLFQEIGYLIDEKGSPRRDVGEDSEFLNMIMKNNYYNLPNFEEMINDILNNYRDYPESGVNEE